MKLSEINGAVRRTWGPIAKKVFGKEGETQDADGIKLTQHMNTVLISCVMPHIDGVVGNNVRRKLLEDYIDDHIGEGWNFASSGSVDWELYRLIINKNTLWIREIALITLQQDDENAMHLQERATAIVDYPITVPKDVAGSVDDIMEFFESLEDLGEVACAKYIENNLDVAKIECDVEPTNPDFSDYIHRND
jgi:hypothetical protein